MVRVIVARGDGVTCMAQQREARAYRAGTSPGMPPLETRIVNSSDLLTSID